MVKLMEVQDGVGIPTEWTLYVVVHILKRTASS